MKRFGMPMLIGITFLLCIVPAWLGWFSNYIQFIITLIGINIILTVSLNLINGYMGEFSVGHAAFMGVGAYTSSMITVYLLTDSTFFGKAILPEQFSILIFPGSIRTNQSNKFIFT